MQGKFMPPRGQHVIALSDLFPFCRKHPRSSRNAPCSRRSLGEACKSLPGTLLIYMP